MIITTVIIVIVIILIVIIVIVIIVLLVMLVMLVIVLKIMCILNSSVCVCVKKCLISFLEVEVLITVQREWKGSI